ncbi:MAG: PAS domain S-box protein [Methanocalculus sp.]|uniref:PAS domain-containing protein n=1 Tax=Methanocalculus sp. TaxID=2004547 RepID=UPI00271D5045|nr:PAS domain S-box protein [Methanocalculus sp.]MDO9539386.1 PAS domain S-box protein [Methanocalculus sp.]
MTGQTDEMIQIKELLKRYPRGMSITEISSTLHLHRNTAAKYLDILKIKGDVDRKQIGTAKNYFLVQRIPVSSLIAYWPVPLIVTDSRLNTVMVTKGVLSLLGCSLDVLYGVEINEIPISLFNDPAIGEICHDAVQGQSQSMTVRTTVKKKDLILRIMGIPIVFDTGRDGGALAFFDETERHKTLRDLDGLKQKYSALLTGQKEYIIHITPSMAIKFLNAPFADRTGRSEGQIPGMSFNTFFPANSHEEIHQLFSGISTADPIGWCDLKMIRRDGTIGREHWEIHGVFDETGVITSYHAVGRDITELAHCRDQLEQYHRNLEDLIDERTKSMQEANRMLMATIQDKEELERELLFIQFAFNHASDSILLLNEEGQVIRANETASTLLGYKPEELTKLYVYDINPTITKAVWQKMWADGYPGKRMRTGSIHRMRNGRIVNVDVSRTFVRFLDRMYFCSIARPIEHNGEDDLVQ